MRQLPRILVALTIALALAPIARAQEPGGPGGPGGGPGGPGGGRMGGMGVTPLQRALDKDGDGVISAGEIADASASLKALDKDGDGQLSAAEYRPAPQPQPGFDPRETVTRMLAFDKDGDGKLTKAELPERLLGFLERADANKDGVVDRDELTRAAEATARRGQPQGGPGGPGGPGGDRPRPPGRPD